MEGNKNHSPKQQLPRQSYNTTKITNTTNKQQKHGTKKQTQTKTKEKSSLTTVQGEES
jgi:hypothetical protein